jgi:hypothetical protein
MTRAPRIAVLVVALSLAGLRAGAGCDQRKATLPPAPPHAGTAFPLPEGKGFVEVLRRDTADRAGQTQLVVYFIDAECKPLRSAPTAASFQPRGRGATGLALKPTGDTDPSKAGELASAPFDNPGDIAGVLSATFDSTPVAIAISVR